MADDADNNLGGGYNYDWILIWPSTTIRWPNDCEVSWVVGCYTAVLMIATGYVTVTLMTFDKKLNGRWTAIELKSNRSYNHRISA